MEKNRTMQQNACRTLRSSILVSARVLLILLFCGLSVAWNPLFAQDKSVTLHVKVAFSHFDAPFEYKDKVLSVQDSKAFGNVLGITISGSYNGRTEELNGKGVIAPAYSINSFLGRIPVVGSLLSGKDGTVFAANYSVSGTINDPKVNINPLSALSPNSLKELFASLFGNGENG